LNLLYTVDETRYCTDSNLKITKRVYDIHRKFVEIHLCKKCSLDPDFDGFVSETKIKEEVLQS